MARRHLILCALALTLAAQGAATADSEESTEPGTAPEFTGYSARTMAVASSPSPVAPLFADSGRISLSVDAVGSNNASGADVDVAKPAGGTVRRAFFTASSTGFTGYQPADGDVTLDGLPVAWDSGRTMTNGIFSVNVWSDVTSLVKPKLDAAAPGRVKVRGAEGPRTSLIDGGILAVVFNDPTAARDRAVVLAYGAQQVTGDRIKLVRLPEVPLSDVKALLGIGVTYGFQPSSQDSIVDVNGTRLTSSAGGQDDGQPSNSALVTVGGLDDNPANPANPFARGFASGCPRCDDELYDLTSFVTASGASLLELTTINPSAGDNFMFAALDVEGATVTWTPSTGGDVEYVAVGDSTTTGFSVPTCDEDRALSPFGCMGNPPAMPYPDRIAAANSRFDGLERKGIWGYTTIEAVDAFENGRNEEGNWEPQLATAQRATELVTVSLGANDMQFSDITHWLGNCVGVKQKWFLGRTYPSAVLTPDRCRTAARARATSPEIATALDKMFDALDVAQDNGTTVVITEYYNPYNHSKHVRFLPDRSCALIHGMAEIITTALNDELVRRANAHGFSTADFKEPFKGHGAGAEDSYVFGTDCETLGALSAIDWDFGWPPVNGGGTSKQIQIQFDPHPNSVGTEAQANAILEVVS